MLALVSAHAYCFHFDNSLLICFPWKLSATLIKDHGDHFLNKYYISIEFLILYVVDPMNQSAVLSNWIPRNNAVWQFEHWRLIHNIDDIQNLNHIKNSILIFIISLNFFFMKCQYYCFKFSNISVSLNSVYEKWNSYKSSVFPHHVTS